MALAGIEDELDGRVGSALDMAVHLHGLTWMHARVFLAVHDEQRGLAVAGVVDRAALEEEVVIVINPLARMYQVLFIRDIGRTPLGDLIADTDKHYTCSKVLGIPG